MESLTNHTTDIGEPRATGSSPAWDLGPVGAGDRPGFSGAAPEDLRRELDPILKPYGLTGDRFLRRLDAAIPLGGKAPWALAFFPEELPLMGHLLSLRKEPMSYRCTPYLLVDRLDGPYLPGLGAVIVWEKTALTPPPAGDGLLEKIWDAIGALPQDRRWCVRVEPPAREWTEAVSKGDAAAFMAAMRAEEDRVRGTWQGDPGLRTVDYAYDLGLEVEPEWSALQEGGFDWWPHALRQVVGTGGVVGSGTAMKHRVIATTEFARDVEPTDEARIAVDALNDRLSGMCAAVLDPDRRTVRLWSTCWMDEANEEWLREDFSAAATLQAVDAENLAAGFAKAAGGEPDERVNKLFGSRQARDERVFERAGDMAGVKGDFNPWFMPYVLEPVMCGLKESGFQVDWEKHGFSFRVPFREESEARISVDCGPRLALGEGLRIDLGIPFEAPLTEMVDIVCRLNLQESRSPTGVDFLGAWTVGPGTREGSGAPVFRQFLPGALFTEEKLPCLVRNMLGRARWVEDMVHDGRPVQGMFSENTVVRACTLVKGERRREVVDLSFRPDGYFIRDGSHDGMLMSIKNEEVRRRILELEAEGKTEEARKLLDITPAEVKSLEEVHPMFMGGNYLPEPEEDEVEIARVSINSTTGDVMCVYAGSEGAVYRYRVVDEYGTDSLAHPHRMESPTPLTLGELLDYFLDAISLERILEMNELGLKEALDFFSADSRFYPDLDEACRDRVWAYYAKR